MYLLLIGKKNQIDLDYIYLSFNSRSDFNKYLHMQCEIAQIVYPKWAYQWINIKNTFTEFYWIESGRKLMKLSFSSNTILIFFQKKAFVIC